MKLPTFRSLRAKLTTSDDVAAALTTNAAQLASARAELAEMEAQRPGLLLDGDDTAVDSLEGRMIDVRRMVARLEARSDALEAELAAIGAREAADALTKRAADMRARAEAAERWLRDEYPALARTIMAGFAELKDAEHDAIRTNKALAAAGREGEIVERIETRVHGARSVGSLLYNTTLMPVPGLDLPGYGQPLNVPWVFGIPGDVHRA